MLHTIGGGKSDSHQEMTKKRCASYLPIGLFGSMPFCCCKPEGRKGLRIGIRGWHVLLHPRTFPSHPSKQLTNPVHTDETVSIEHIYMVVHALQFLRTDALFTSAYLLTAMAYFDYHQIIQWLWQCSSGPCIGFNTFYFSHFPHSTKLPFIFLRHNFATIPYHQWAI